jgi:hypothetical protein
MSRRSCEGGWREGQHRTVHTSEVSMGSRPDLCRVAVGALGEDGVDVEVAIVGDDRPGLHLGHPEAGRRRAKLLKREQNGRVGKRSDLDRHALGPLRKTEGGNRRQNSKAMTAEGQRRPYRGAENLRVLTVVGDDDPAVIRRAGWVSATLLQTVSRWPDARVGRLGENLLAQLARSATLNRVQSVVDPERQCKQGDDVSLVRPLSTEVSSQSDARNALVGTIDGDVNPGV